MTENEAIEDLEFFQEKLHNGIFGNRTECLNVAIDALKQIHQYRSIGTVEQCREAVEKQKAKIPGIWGDGSDAEGRIIYDMYDCPNCGKSYEIDYEKYDHCPSCGQAIDWSGLEKSGGESDE